MKLNDIFQLYDSRLPVRYEIKDTSHGEDDFRQAIIAEWPDRKLVIKLASNDFSTPERVCDWRNTIEAYRELGYDCPRILPDVNGNFAAAVEFDGKICTLFAEEFARHRIGGDESKRDGNGRYLWHDDAIRSIGRVGAAKLTVADHPSGMCLFDTYAPSDETDEVFESALDFKALMEEKYPQFGERFTAIWNTYLENMTKLEKIYSSLPRSVFQADLNPTNILVDDDNRLMGMFDFNLSGRETVLNYLFREAMVFFYEDVIFRCELDGYSAVFDRRDVAKAALESLEYNIRVMKEVYSFSEKEIEAAPLLYRHLRTFWWQPACLLPMVGEDTQRVKEILDWCEKVLSEEIDFRSIMT